MGVRYRKSINLGGGARINISKSGIGYSVGTKGFRVTQTANGRTRTTVSAPGTGLSYVSESSNKKARVNRSNAVKKDDIDKATGFNLKDVPKVEEIYDNKVSNWNPSFLWMNALYRIQKWSLVLCCINFVLGIFIHPLFMVFLLCLAITLISRIFHIKLVFKSNKKDTDVDCLYQWEDLFRSSKVWYVDKIITPDDPRQTRGISTILSRHEATFDTEVPRYIRTTNKFAHIYLDYNKDLYILPYAILVRRKNRHTVITDFDICYNEFLFTEYEELPSDAVVVDYVWEHQNKDGTPSKRYRDNNQYAQCRYGCVKITGKDISIMLVASNPEFVKAFKPIVH